MANVLVWATGLAGIALATSWAWRWRALPVVAERPAPDGRGQAALEGLRTVALSLWAGLAAGFLVPGLGGRLLMRITAATSPAEAQGRLTDAQEVVGEITLGGTIGFLFFIGLFGGALYGLAHPFVRALLPRRAGPAGVVVAVVLLGTVGVSDPMSPDNSDFALLTPGWLAVALIVLVTGVFGVAYMGLAARLEQAVPRLSRRTSTWLAHLPLLLALIPPIGAVTVVVTAGRALLHARSSPWEWSRARPAVTALVAAAVAVTTMRSLMAAVQILGA